MREDAVSLLPKTEFTRREFVVTSLAAGFAMAVRPVSAQTITTNTIGLTADEVKIPVESGEIPAYRAMPASGGPFPVVLVVQEIFGVHEHIKDICRRFAKSGHLAVAPELFARQGDVSKMPDVNEIISKVVSKVPDAEVMSDLDAAVAWAQKSGKGDTSKLGITGFCWGGRVVWLYAAHNPAESGRGLVRALARAAERPPTQESHRPGGLAESPGAGSLWRKRSGHSRRDRRKDAAGAPGRWQQIRNYSLSRHATRLPC